LVTIDKVVFLRFPVVYRLKRNSAHLKRDSACLKGDSVSTGLFKPSLAAMILVCLCMGFGYAQDQTSTQTSTQTQNQTPDQKKTPASAPPPQPQATQSAKGSQPKADNQPKLENLPPAKETPETEQPASGAALRNENVFASKLDTDTQKADDSRLGVDYVVVMKPVVESSFYAAEDGKSPSSPSVLGRATFPNAWHGELFESLQNSVFNARTFFQVGPVQPSHSNQYGGRFSGQIPKLGTLTGTFGQNKVRGMVNGNALVPLPSERTPLTTDPATAAIISRFLAAYPDVAPNRTDFDPRALNTNSPQVINDIDSSLRLDHSFGAAHQLSLFDTISRQNIQAFQLVAGANPDTSIHSQRAQATYRYVPSEATEFSLGAEFLRNRSDLHPEPNAVGPRVRLGRVIDNLGPDDMYPLNRVENTFRWGAVGYHSISGGKHRLTFGGDLYRYQLNGFEQSGQRGNFSFSNNFGRSALENMLLGIPTSYSINVGNMYRGFRNWTTNTFIADQWTVTNSLQIYIGVRHTLSTVPVEVNNLNSLPYKTDWNNFSPRFSFAWRAPAQWLVRGSYSISYGEILPVTYSQVRLNPPGSITVQVANPSLVNPLAGIDLNAPNVRSSIIQFSPDLVAPYSHQYGISFEHSFGDTLHIELAYLGSRSLKLLNFYQMNRADPVPGIPLTTATVNDRRPDPRYYDVFDIVNSGIAYLDAARFTWSIPNRWGLSAGGSYTFSKALDEGAIYTSTAANKDLFNRSQWQYETLKDKKGLSNFDSPHDFTFYATYNVPRLPGHSALLNGISRGWQLSAIATIRTGTPFTVYVGSDSPGFGNVDGSGSDRPNILDPSILGATVGNPDTSTQILSPSRFSYIAPGEHRGNLAFNAFRKQGIRNVNASVNKEWRWDSGRRTYLLRFRAEAFNLTNHPQFDAPQNALSAPSFGKITNTLNNGRVFQLGLQLSL
jgi:hypothetical protein